MTTKTFEFPDNLTLESLQRQIRPKEAFGRELKKLQALDTGSKRFTLATMDSASPGKTGLRLALDPSGAQAPKPGEKLVCRGEAWIQTFKQKVAAFRPA